MSLGLTVTRDGGWGQIVLSDLQFDQCATAATKGALSNHSPNRKRFAFCTIMNSYLKKRKSASYGPAD